MTCWENIKPVYFSVFARVTNFKNNIGNKKVEKLSSAYLTSYTIFKSAACTNIGRLMIPKTANI